MCCTVSLYLYGKTIIPNSQRLIPKPRVCFVSLFSECWNIDDNLVGELTSPSPQGLLLPWPLYQPLELVPPALPVVRTLPGASFYTTQLIPIGWTLSLQVNLDQIGENLKLYARDHQQWSPVIIPASVISASSPILWQSGKNLVKIRTGWVKFYCS